MTASACPAPDVHGKPFRYCPYCDWREAVPPAPVKLAELLDADKLRRLAELMDELDRRRVAEFGPQAYETEVQDDLRCWADGVEQGRIV